VSEIRKADPAPDYPPEEGCYVRGNDYSPVAVLVILKWTREETPPGIEDLVRAGVESGAALSGTLQTENIGLEKVICNVVANPNIRYLLVCGPESPGHHVGETILALMQNGIDERKRIIGTSAQTPYLFNIPAGLVERFRRQITVIDLIDEGRPEVIREAVRRATGGADVVSRAPAPRRRRLWRTPDQRQDHVAGHGPDQGAQERGGAGRVRTDPGADGPRQEGTEARPWHR
jgi:tetrahydromethanopterin S-methyltransferase subunit A